MEVIKSIINNYEVENEEEAEDLEALKQCYNILVEEVKKIPFDKCNKEKCKRQIQHIPFSIHFNYGRCRKCEPAKEKPLKFIPSHLAKKVMIENEKVARENERKYITDQLKSDSVVSISFIKPPTTGLPKIMKAKLSNLNIVLN